MKRRGFAVVLGTLLVLAIGASTGWAQAPQANLGQAAQGADRPPDGKGFETIPQNRAKPGGSSNTNGILYHGGPLILGGVNVYYIWYGDWSYNTGAASILEFFSSNLGGSPRFNINTTYYNGSGIHVPNKVIFAGSTTDAYSQGTSLTDSQIQTIVASAIQRGALPADHNGVYFVLTSKDVREVSGFCSSYCGWHTHGTLSGTDIKYSFVGDPAQCPSGCAAQWSTSPNGNPTADGMANIIAHELEEAVTDPDLNAWYDRRGYENADKCAWTFGSTSLLPNGSYYNMVLTNSSTSTTRPFLIQRNWVNSGSGYCAMSY